MTGKTYGSITLRDGTWHIQAEPQVAIMLKRLFTRASQNVTGQVTFSDTPSVARDLEWFTLRWPLDIAAAAAEHLTRRAAAHRGQEEEVFRILEGYRPPRGWQEPAIPARDYQLAVPELVYATGRVLLGDEIGLGKTVTSLLTLRNPEALPALIVTPANLCAQWHGELGKFLPWLTGHVITRRVPYDLAELPGPYPDVLIISYPKLQYWADHLTGAVTTVIYEEIQELRRGTQAAKGIAAQMISGKARYRIGVSASPVKNFGGEIWRVIQALDPDALGDENEFSREWCGETRGIGRHTIVTNPHALGRHLRSSGLMIRRTRKELHMELPDPIRIEQKVDTDHTAIDQVAADLIEQAKILLGEAEATGSDRWRAASQVDWQLRRATGLAKAPYVAAFVRLLLESEDRVLMFGWHRDVYAIWMQELAEFSPLLYSGSETPAQKARHAAAFIAGDCRVLIMSHASGAGLDGLQNACSVCVFGELDWSPEQHDQEIGRLARDGQQSTVIAYFMTSDDGTDPYMAEVLGLKRAQIIPLRDPDTELFQTRNAEDTDRSRQLAAYVLRRAAARAQPGEKGLW